MLERYFILENFIGKIIIKLSKAYEKEEIKDYDDVFPLYKARTKEDLEKAKELKNILERFYIAGTILEKSHDKSISLPLPTVQRLII